MASEFTPDEALLQRLPLPLAQMYRRAHHARMPLERHFRSFRLWEAALKLLGSVAIAEYAQVGEVDPSLAERLQNLARPSLGHWCEFVRLLVPVLAGKGRDSFGEIRDFLLGSTRAELPRAARLDAGLRKILDRPGHDAAPLDLDADLRKTLDGHGGSASVSLAKLFDHLVAYRNRVLAHAAPEQLKEEFNTIMAQALLAAAAEVLGRIDLLAHRRLVYIADVRQSGAGWLIERYNLTGENVRRLESLEWPLSEAARLPLRDRLYLDDPQAGPPTPFTPPLLSLGPLVLFDFEDEQVLFLDSRRGKQRLEYLCHTTGHLVSRQDLGGEQCALLAKVLHLPGLADEQLAQWANRAQSEEPEHEGQTPPEENTLAGFVLKSELGRGGMGVVYRAWQPFLGREVALKKLQRPGDVKTEARFRREIRALGKVEHPHLVKIFTSGSQGNEWYYAMELVEGVPLSAVCDRLETRTTSVTEVDMPTWLQTLGNICDDARQAEKPLSEPRGEAGEGQGMKGEDNEGISSHAPRPAALAPHRSYARHIVDLVAQVAEAAHALHEAGILHRDIKPGNIMVSANGTQAVLMDLGLAQLADDTEGRLTRTRQFVGTLRYASPQQVLAVSKLDRRGDVYSLGATLWELLALRPLFGATDQTPTPELMEKIQREEPERLRKNHPGLARDLEAIVHKCLEKSPDQRYASALELARDLRRFLEGAPVRARPVNGWERAVKWVKRHPATAALYGLILMVTVLGGLGGTMSWRAAEMTRLRDMAVDKEREATEQRKLAEKEEQEAKKQRELAEINEREAKKQRALAETNEREAKKQKERAERFQYAADINLAQQAFQENRLFRMRELLLRHEKAEHLKSFEWYYLWELCKAKLILGPRHQKPAWAIAFAPDGRRAVSGSIDSAVKIWDTATGQELLALAGHRNSVFAVAFSPNGKRVASASVDRTVRVWDSSDGKELYLVPEADSTAVAFSPDGRHLALAGLKNKVVICDAVTGKQQWTLTGHTDRIWGVAFSPDNKLLASNSRDKTVKLWDVEAGKLVRTLEGPDTGYYVAFSPDGKLLGSTHSDAILVWDLATGKEVRRYNDPKSFWPRGISFSPDGRQLVATGGDGTVRIRALAADKPATVLYGPGGPVYGGVFSPDGTRLALCGGSDGSVHIWDLTVGDDALTVSWATAGSGFALAQSPDGRWLAEGGANNEVCLWDPETGRKVRSFKGHTAKVLDVAFSPDGRWLVSGGEDKTARVWEVEDGRELSEFRKHDTAVLRVAYDPKGRFVATEGSDGIIKVWDPRNGRELASLQKPHGSLIGTLTFSPDGNRLASTGSQQFSWWDTATWKANIAPSDIAAPPVWVAYCPDNVRVATGAVDGTIVVRDQRQETVFFDLHGHIGMVYALTFSPDRRRLVSAGADSTVRFWDLETGQPLIAVHGNVTSLVFSPDNRRLASVADQDIQIWFAGNMPGAGGSVPKRWLTWYRKKADDVFQAKQWFATAFYCSRLIEADPTREAHYRRFRAFAALELRDWRRAEADLTRALELTQPTVSDYHNRSLAFSGLGRYELVEADLTRALKIDPKYRAAWAVRGEARARLGKWADAIADYTQALALSDTDDATWWLRGAARAELGRWDQAIADFTKAIERAPASLRDLSSLVVAHLGRGDLLAYRRACATMYERFSRTDQPDIWMRLSWICSLTATGAVEPDQLVKQMDKAVTARPKSWDFLNTRGVVLYRAGRYQDALDQLKAAVALHGQGGAFEDRVFLAMAHHQLKNPDQAKEWLAKAVQQMEKSLKAKDYTAPIRPPSWEARIVWEILRQEAALLIEGKNSPSGN